MVRAARDIKLLHCENSFLMKLNAIINNCTDIERESGNRKNLHYLARSQFVTWTDFLLPGDTDVHDGEARHVARHRADTV